MMKIAIFSDSHDHIWNIRKAVKQASDLGVEAIIHCGDLISPFMLEELDPFPGKIHLIYGNNAGDRSLMTTHCASRKGHVHHHGQLGRLEMDGFSLGWVHDPATAYLVAKSGEFDLVCYGHTHRWRLEKVEKTVLLNPGEILGKKEPAGWALVEIAESSKLKAQRKGTNKTSGVFPLEGGDSVIMITRILIDKS